jgi:hypothetical protein
VFLPVAPAVYDDVAIPQPLSLSSKTFTSFLPQPKVPALGEAYQRGPVGAWARSGDPQEGLGWTDICTRSPDTGAMGVRTRGRDIKTVPPSSRQT